MIKLKVIISIFIILTITPLLVIISLTVLNPAQFGGASGVSDILMLYMFSIITVPLWITYIPAIILTPIIMNKVEKKKYFYKIPVIKLIIFSALIGAILGGLVLTPVLFLVFNESNQLILSWVFAAMISGGITLSIITLLYRINSNSNKSPTNAIKGIGWFSC